MSSISDRTLKGIREEIESINGHLERLENDKQEGSDQLWDTVDAAYWNCDNLKRFIIRAHAELKFGKEAFIDDPILAGR